MFLVFLISDHNHFLRSISDDLVLYRLNVPRVTSTA